MSARLVLVGLLSAGWALGGYVYDYSAAPVLGTSPWSVNGSVNSWSPSTQFNSGGSLIYTPTVSGAVSNDYEINTTLALASGGGTYINYVRASSNALASASGCTGSYTSIEVVVPSSYVSGGAAAQVNLKQCVSGSLSWIWGVPATVVNGSTLRTVVYGTTLLAYLDNDLVVWTTTGIASGQPAFGGYGMSAGSGFSQVMVGPRDVIAPNPVVATGVRSSVLPNQVSLAWQGATDNAPGSGVNGIGVGEYYVARGVGTSPTTWTVLGWFAGAEMGDSTVAAGTTYTYMLVSIDFHWNVAAATFVAVTTPPATAVDPRRVGVSATGSYWGGGGEQIDTRSGNLNFSVPVVAAQGRTGWSVSAALNYNSQNWRLDGGASWELGSDVGYGFGWSLQIGSITPYYLTYDSGVNHYVYTDGTGAQYLLSQNSGNVWSSTQGIYIWFDANTNTLHFKDGSFWLMGCVSGGAEQDAGTMYPTILEDVSGNQLS